METLTIATKTPPVIKGHPIWGKGLEFRNAPVPMLLDLQKEYGNLFCLKVFVGMYYNVIMSPESVEYVLRGNQKNFIKPDLVTQTMARLTGKALITNEGESWHQQRKLMSPAFNRNKFSVLMDESIGEIQGVIDKWKSLKAEDSTLDIQQEMMYLTMQIASKTLFSSDILSKADEVGQAVHTALGFIGEGLANPLLIHNFLPTNKRRKFDESKRVLEKIIAGIIHERVQNHTEKHDLLGMLLAAKDEETNTLMTERQLIDEVLGLIIAGHETTSLALTWTWYLLALNPNKFAKLREELAAVLNGRTPTVADYHKLPYTLQVFQESMRMYPPAWAVVRMAIEDDIIEGYEIPAGTMLFLPFWASNHNPDLWENPMVFEPERFSAEAVAARHKYAYVPFGGGMRQCIGNHFAMMEAVLVIATLAQHFRFELSPNQSIKYDTGFTLKSKEGIKMKIIADR